MAYLTLYTSIAIIIITCIIAVRDVKVMVEEVVKGMLPYAFSSPSPKMSIWCYYYELLNNSFNENQSGY